MLCQYQNLFSYLEAYHLLDSLLDIHLLALHFVYIPRINHALEEFVRQHNNHPLRTERNTTPLQLYMVSPTSVDHIVADVSMYGVEEAGPVSDILSTCKASPLVHHITKMAHADIKAATEGKVCTIQCSLAREYIF